MAGVVRNTVRVGVIVLLVGGTVTAIAGPSYVRAVVHQARSTVQGAIDKHVDDPVALREQLRSLQAQYPDKIASVRRDLGQLRTESESLRRELEVSRRVVKLAESDMSGMESLLSRAEEARSEHDGFVTVRVRFGGDSLAMDEAVDRAAQIRETRDAYAVRVQELERDLTYLTRQEDRLAGILSSLESEQREFQSQLFQIDRQIDTIARNDRLIGLMEERERSIEKHSRFEAASLDQFQSRMSDIRAVQEARLARLASLEEQTSYEDRARKQIEAMPSLIPSVSRSVDVEIEPDVIEIEPGEGKASKSMVHATQ